MLLAPTATALQTLLEVCHTYAGHHDIVKNTTKTVCMQVRPKQSHAGSVLNKSQAWKLRTSHCRGVSLPRACHDGKLSR